MAKYQIKQLSEITSVTVRTLQYYDEIGLLTPSSRTEAGYRVYSDDDVSRLQFINTFKFFGYSLKKIKTFLDDNEWDLLKALDMQSSIIEKKRQQLGSAQRLISQVRNQLQQQESVDWTLMSKIIQIFHKEDKKLRDALSTLLSTEEMRRVNQIHATLTEEFYKDYTARWQAMYEKVSQCLHLNPASEKAQQLLQEWMGLVEEVYGDDKKLQNKVWQGIKSGALPTEQSQANEQAIFTFIERAYASAMKEKQKFEE